VERILGDGAWFPGRHGSVRILDLHQDEYFEVLVAWSRQADYGLLRHDPSSLVKLTTKLVSLYLEKHVVPAADLPALIEAVFRATEKLVNGLTHGGRRQGTPPLRRFRKVPDRSKHSFNRRRSRRPG
jgi:hypothetical protein